MSFPFLITVIAAIPFVVRLFRIFSAAQKPRATDFVELGIWICAPILVVLLLSGVFLGTAPQNAPDKTASINSSKTTIGAKQAPEPFDPTPAMCPKNIDCPTGITGKQYYAWSRFDCTAVGDIAAAIQHRYGNSLPDMISHLKAGVQKFHAVVPDGAIRAMSDQVFKYSSDTDAEIRKYFHDSCLKIHDNPDLEIAGVIDPRSLPNPGNWQLTRGEKCRLLSTASGFAANLRDEGEPIGSAILVLQDPTLEPFVREYAEAIAVYAYSNAFISPMDISDIVQQACRENTDLMR